MTAIAWKQAASGDWANAANWLTGLPTAAADVTIGLVGNYVVAVTSADAASTLTVDAPGAALLETAGSLTLGGALTLRHGLVALDRANTFGGGVTLNGGELSVGDSGALGAGNLTINGGEFLATANVTIANRLVMSGSFAIAAAHGVTLDFTSASQWTLNESSGSVIEIGAAGEDGVVIWHAPFDINNVGTNALEVRGGTLRADSGGGLAALLDDTSAANVSAGATIDIAGHDATIASLVGAGAVTNSGPLANLTLNNTGVPFTVLRAFTGRLSGAMALIVSPGTVTLTGANAYSGGTTIAAGATLQLGDGGASGSVQGDILDNGFLGVARSDAITLSNAISGVGQLEQLGFGTTTIKTGNSYSGGTTVLAGTLAVGGGAALGSGTLTLQGGQLLATTSETIANRLILVNAFDIAAAHGATLTFNSASPWTLTENAGLTMTIGAPAEDGTVVWSEAGGAPSFLNSGVGLLEVRAGVLKAADRGVSDLTSNTLQTTVDAGATIDCSGHDVRIFGLVGSGAITSAAAANLVIINGGFGGVIGGSLSVEIASVVQLTGANSYSGVTTIDASGNLVLGDGGATGSIAGGPLTDLGVLTIDRNNATTLAVAISGAGVLKQLGSGTTTIATANTYSGGTILSAGTLAVGNAQALGSGGIAVNGGDAAELFGAATETISNPLTMSGSLTVAAKHGTTLTLANSGGWTLNSGAEVDFGAAGQDGTVIWQTPMASVVNGPQSQLIHLKAGVLKAGDAAFDIVLSAAANVVIDAGATLDLAGFNARPSNLQGRGAIVDSGAGGVLTLAGFYNFDGSISGALSLSVVSTGQLGVHSVVAVSGGTTIATAVIFDSASVFDLTSDAGVSSGGAGATFVNIGRFEKTAGAGFSTVATSFNNLGEVLVTSGQIDFTGGFINSGVVEGVLTEGGGFATITANAPGQTTFFGGSGDNLVKVGVAPTFFDGGAGADTVEATASMAFAAGSLINVETVKVDNGFSVNLGALTLGEHIVLASVAGGGATVLGTRGGDTIVGGAGHDLINGGFGADVMAGGGGNDVYFVDNAGDKVVEAATGGTDLVKSSVSFSLAANVENLTLIGNAATNGIGNSGANAIVGNGAANSLRGGGGADTLTGGLGADRFVFGSPGEGGDTIADFSQAQHDAIFIGHAAFGGGLPASGPLASNRLVSGSNPAANAHLGQFLFDTATHTLSWDADGTGVGAAVTIATLNGVSSLVAADIRLF